VAMSTGRKTVKQARKDARMNERTPALCNFVIVPILKYVAKTEIYMVLCWIASSCDRCAWLDMSESEALSWSSTISPSALALTLTSAMIGSSSI
jgi:hypothetical protein